MKRTGFLALVCFVALLARLERMPAEEPAADVEPVRMAIQDLMESFPDRFTRGPVYLEQLARISQLPEGPERNEALWALRSEALLANPLLNFGRIVLVRRKSEGDRGLPANWQGNERLKGNNYTNDVAMFSLDRPKAPLRTVFRPRERLFVGDLDLHFDGKRLLFSMPGRNGRWQIHQLTIDPSPGGQASSDGAPSDRAPSDRASSDWAVADELTTIPDDDVDNYDACYLPDGNIIFTSTATYTGVPCVKGNSHVANLYRLDVGTQTVRRLTFDQDHNWNPTLLNNGRVMYLRWEYADLPHFVARILFHMNPDGTNQSEFYGSGSYWPNSFFYARAVPDHPTRVVGIVTGHHGARRAGELVILDPALGRREADGVVQRIPGRGKAVEPVIVDQLVDASWPKFLHPYPLSSKYFLVSMQPHEGACWGIYLVDVFDNLIPLREEPGFDLFEPTALIGRPVPPAIASVADSAKEDALVYLEDIYLGEGLRGVPRGTVKNLRLITYHFAYRGMGGQQDPLGLDGPWDIKCVLGTVPVEPDGSALFYVPANLPISYQPLDDQGRAIQLMRSWSTAMPGEKVSCVGCHERQNSAPPSKTTIAVRSKPARITPWHGPPRGFSFRREVEPLVFTYCAGCHPAEADAATLADASPTTTPPTTAPPIGDAYMFLRRHVRTPTIEPDMHVLEPYEYHADTSELVRMLRDGHYGVELDGEAWDRLITWIDLNTPRYGSWTANVGRQRVGNSPQRRRDLMKRYAGIDGIVEDADAEAADAQEARAKSVVDRAAVLESIPTEVASSGQVKVLDVSSTDDAVRRTKSVLLKDGSELKFVRIPAGTFQSAGSQSAGSQSAGSEIRIEKPFWMAQCEITNRQYALYDPSHDSRLEPLDFLHFDPQRRGSPLNDPQQPAVKISWEKAVGYCGWLSEETGHRFDLPTEAEWEWACRAGTETPLWYGRIEAPFAARENLADACFHESISGSVEPWKPAIVSQNDGYRVSAPVGSFQPNPWGLYDMHGNVAEWTASEYVPSSEASSTMVSSAMRTARGGSWSDRPKWAAAEMRRGYRDFQKVYNVGFRVVLRDD